MSAAEVVQEDALTLLERERRTSASLAEEVTTQEREIRDLLSVLTRVEFVAATGCNDTDCDVAQSTLGLLRALASKARKGR